MILSLVRRFISALLLLWVISIIAFWLSKLTPGDEVMDYLSIDDPRYNINSNPAELRAAYQLIAHRRGFDLPLFYWSVSPGYFPDSVGHILPMDDREAVTAWIKDSKKGNLSLQLYKQLHAGLLTACTDPAHLRNSDQQCQAFNRAIKMHDIRDIQKNIIALKDTIQNSKVEAGDSLHQVSSMLGTIEQLLAPGHADHERWMPLIEWNGTANQYHQWMTGLISQRPLTSLVDGLNAWSKIYAALKWTLLLNGLAFLLALVLGVGIGIWSGTHDGRPLERIANWILFALFALPSFWLGTLFIYFFTSGEWLSIFPSGGLGSYQSAGTIAAKWAILSAHLFLPVTCLAIGSLAYVSRQMKQSILHQFSQPYVNALRAQGISEKTILKKHVIRNALFPVITIIGGAIPALLSGSLILEVIFSIPGMGRLMYNSLLSRDWPVVFPVLMLGAAITIFSYALTDIIYKWADPRVKTI